MPWKTQSCLPQSRPVAADTILRRVSGLQPSDVPPQLQGVTIPVTERNVSNACIGIEDKVTHWGCLLYEIGQRVDDKMREWALRVHKHNDTVVPNSRVSEVRTVCASFIVCK